MGTRFLLDTRGMAEFVFAGLFIVIMDLPLGPR